MISLTVLAAKLPQHVLRSAVLSVEKSKKL